MLCVIPNKRSHSTNHPNFTWGGGCVRVAYYFIYISKQYYLHIEIIANWRPMVFVGFQKYLTRATSDLKIMTKCRNKSKNNYIKRRNPISYPILREPPESISTIGAVIQK